MQRNHIIVIHGTGPTTMVCQALEAAGLQELIPHEALIAFKPNLVVSKDASSGAVTHPEIVEACVGWLRTKGFARFVIMEGSWVGDSTPRAFTAAGYRELSERIGVPLVDLQRDTWKRYDAGGGQHIAVCDAAMAADFLINLPVLKGHCQTTVTFIHGLARLDERGLLKRLDTALGARHEKRIAIGRDFTGTAWDGVGCGRCTSGAKDSIPGCPPTVPRWQPSWKGWRLEDEGIIPAAPSCIKPTPVYALGQ